MNSVNAKWWQEPLRVLDVVYFSQIDQFDAEAFGRQCRDLHANVVHFHCHSEGGGFRPDGVYARSRVATRENRDILAEFIPVAKRHGIRVILYLNGHWFSKAFVEKHPDWWVLREDGSRVDDLYGTDDSTFCINSPWREWMKTRIEDFCEYDIDGFLWDGPISLFRQRACYCPWCREKFKQQHGREMPSWDRDRKEDWNLLAEFATASLVEYYRDAYRWVKSLRPEFCVYMNAANVSEPMYAAGRDNRRLLPYTDVLLAEGGFHYGRILNRPWKTSASSKFYETQAGGKPSINAVSSADSPWRRCQLSGPEMRLLMFNASTGSNPYYAFFVEGLGQAGDAAAGEVAAFLEKNVEYYSNTRSGAKVAILCSTHTLNRYAGVDIPWADISGIQEQKAAVVGNHSRSFYGFYEMLVRARVPFDVIDDVAIESGKIDRYDLIVLPTSACMSNAENDRLAQFVRNGGNVIADFETSHYDESGRRKEEFGLSEVFGVSSLNEIVGVRKQDFVQLLEMSRFAGPVDFPIVPATRHNLKVVPTTAETRAVFSERVVSDIPGTVEYTDEPFMVENRLGRGKCVFFSGTFGELYQERRFPSYAGIVEGFVRQVACPDISLENAPHLIEVNLRDQPGRQRRMVHLANYEIQPIQSVIPACDLSIRVKSPWKVNAVKSLRMDAALEFRQDQQAVTFVLPRLDEYDVIVLE